MQMRSPSRVNMNQTYAIKIRDVDGHYVSSTKVNISDTTIMIAILLKFKNIIKNHFKND